MACTPWNGLPNKYKTKHYLQLLECKMFKGDLFKKDSHYIILSCNVSSIAECIVLSVFLFSTQPFPNSRLILSPVERSS